MYKVESMTYRTIRLAAALIIATMSWAVIAAATTGATNPDTVVSTVTEMNRPRSGFNLGPHQTLTIIYRHPNGWARSWCNNQPWNPQPHTTTAGRTVTGTPCTIPNIITTDHKVAMGLAIPFPAMSGAEP